MPRGKRGIPPAEHPVVTVARPPGYPVSPFSGVYHPVRGSESGSFVILC